MSCRVFGVGIVAGILLASSPLVVAAEAPNPAASPSPAAAPSIAPLADKLLTGACQALASSNAFTFRAEILFDELLPHAVKVQFAGALDFALQCPDGLMVDYRSDLGSKMLWYQGTRLPILDPSHAAYSMLSVPGSIDGMLEQVATSQGLTIPLSDPARSATPARTSAKRSSSAVTSGSMTSMELMLITSRFHPAEKISSSGWLVLGSRFPLSWSSTIEPSRGRPNISLLFPTGSSLPRSLPAGFVQRFPRT